MSARATHAKSRTGGSVRRISHKQSLAQGAEAFKYFTRIRARLYKDPAYRGKFVAIRDRQIVDVGDDKLILYQRLLTRFPDHRFIVSQVLQEIPTVSIDSFAV